MGTASATCFYGKDVLILGTVLAAGIRSLVVRCWWESSATVDNDLDIRRL